MRYVEPLPGHYDASDPFGNASPPRTTPHLGSDYNGVPEGTQFQIAANGQVVINERGNVLGWVLGVHNDDGKFIGYCHQLEQSPHPIGSRVTLGETGGKVGNTGSASRGAHLHINLGDTIKAIWGTGVQDPHAYIVAHSTTTSNTETTQFEEGAQEMKFIRNSDAGDGSIAEVGEFTFREYSAKELFLMEAEQTLWGSFVNVTGDQYRSIRDEVARRKANLLSVGNKTIDYAQLVASIKIPTVDEIAAATTALHAHKLANG